MSPRNTKSVNKHLNMFRYYDQNESPQDEENNISRGLAICMTHDETFIKKVLEKIIVPDKYNSLFSLSDECVMSAHVDIQRKVKSFPGDYKTIFGVTLTTKKYTADEIQNREPGNTTNPIPDILVGIGDALVLFEVKRYDDSGKSIRQVQNQAEIARKSLGIHKDNVTIKSRSWEQVLELMEGYTEADSEKAGFVRDFLHYITSGYPSWLPIKLLPELNPTDEKRINRRLREIKQSVKDDLQEIGNREVIPLPFEWANEGHISFDGENENLVVKLWAGDTKSQGKNLFNNHWNNDWVKKNSIGEYELGVYPGVKFAHIQGKWVSGIKFQKDDERYLNTHTLDGFKKLVGKWERNASDESKSWDKLEKLLDEKLGKSWRETDNANWKENFLHTDKTFVYVSLRYEIEVVIPFEKAQQLDDERENPKLAEEVNDIFQQIGEMISAVSL